jgi:hypothetical protein
MKRYIGIGMFLCACAAAQAEQLYIIDKLVVGVYPQVESEEGKLANLETGDTVEALERSEKHIRVRLSNGTEGWVRASYLTSQPPAMLRLKELQASSEAPAAPSPQLMQELAQLKERNTALLKEVDTLKQAAVNLAAEQAKIPAQTLAPTAQPERASISEPPVAPVYGESEFNESKAPAPLWTTPLWIWAAVVAGMTGLGYLLGYQTFARRIRQKYGNVRII